jgi:hypothetical protein
MVAAFIGGAMWASRRINNAEASVAHVVQGKALDRDAAAIDAHLWAATSAVRLNGVIPGSARYERHRNGLEAGLAGLNMVIQGDARSLVGDLEEAWAKFDGQAAELIDMQVRNLGRHKRAIQAVDQASALLRHDLATALVEGTPQLTAKLRLITELDARVWQALVSANSRTRRPGNSLDERIDNVDHARRELAALNLTDIERGQMQSFELGWQSAVRLLRDAERTNNTVTERTERLIATAQDAARILQRISSTNPSAGAPQQTR